MVDRLMARWWASLMKVAASSSRLQRVAGWSRSSVLLVARVMTAVSSSGGKAPGSAGAWGVLEASQAVVGEAFAPLADGMAVAVQFVGDLLVGGSILLGRTEDETTAKGQGLRRGPSPEEGFQLLACLRGEQNA